MFEKATGPKSCLPSIEGTCVRPVSSWMPQLDPGPCP